MEPATESAACHEMDSMATAQYPSSQCLAAQHPPSQHRQPELELDLEPEADCVLLE